jgi:hypothetical protein
VKLARKLKVNCLFSHTEKRHKTDTSTIHAHIRTYRTCFQKWDCWPNGVAQAAKVGRLEDTKGGKKEKNGTRHWWLMSVILAMQEAGIRRISVQSQPRQIVSETLSQKYSSQKKAGGVGQSVGPEFKPI